MIITIAQSTENTSWTAMSMPEADGEPEGILASSSSLPSLVARLAAWITDHRSLEAL